MLQPNYDYLKFNYTDLLIFDRVALGVWVPRYYFPERFHCEWLEFGTIVAIGDQKFADA